MSRRATLFLCNVLVYLTHPSLIRRFYARLGYFPNVAAPRSYNEKLLWRKIFDHNPLFVTFTDKLTCKDFVQSVCPDLRLPKTLWTGDNPHDIPCDLLHGNVVVKATHGCGFNFFVAKNPVDRAHLCRKVTAWLRETYGSRDGEWAYRLVRPRLLVEEMLDLGGSGLPTDLKLHMCSGHIVHAWVIDKHSGRAATLDARGSAYESLPTNCLLMQQMGSRRQVFAAAFERAAAFAVRLSKDIDYARVDFLLAGEQVFGGEITVYPAAGYDRWDDPTIAKNLTRAWDIRKSAFFGKDQRGLRGAYARALFCHLRQ